MKKNSTIPVTVLFTREIEICPASISRINSNCKKQIILLMKTNEEKEGWHYLAVKRLLALLRGKTSKHHRDSMSTLNP